MTPFIRRRSHPTQHRKAARNRLFVRTSLTLFRRERDHSSFVGGPGAATPVFHSIPDHIRPRGVPRRELHQFCPHRLLNHPMCAASQQVTQRSVHGSSLPESNYAIFIQERRSGFVTSKFVARPFCAGHAAFFNSSASTRLGYHFAVGYQEGRFVDCQTNGERNPPQRASVGVRPAVVYD